MGNKTPSLVHAASQPDLISTFATSLRTDLWQLSPWYIRPLVTSYGARWWPIFESNARREHHFTTSNGNMVTIQYNDLLLFIRDRCTLALQQLIPACIALCYTIALFITMYMVICERWSLIIIATILHVRGASSSISSPSVLPFGPRVALRYAMEWIAANIIMTVVIVGLPQLHIIPKNDILTYTRVNDTMMMVLQSLLTLRSLHHWYQVMILPANAASFSVARTIICAIAWEARPINIASYFLSSSSSSWFSSSPSTIPLLVIVRIVISCVTLVLLSWSLPSIAPPLPPRAPSRITSTSSVPSSSSAPPVPPRPATSAPSSSVPIHHHTLVEEFLPRGSINLMLVIRRLLTIALEYRYALTMTNIVLMMALWLQWFQLGSTTVIIKGMHINYWCIWAITSIIIIAPLIILCRHRSSPPSHYQRCSIPINDGNNASPRFVRLMDVILTTSKAT